MPRKKVQTEETIPKRREYIGHITTPIENDLEYIQTLLKQHNVLMLKCKTDDNWWTLLFPHETTKMLQKTEDEVTCYTIQLPDGYSFLYVPPLFNHEKRYERLPRIAITREPQDA